MTYAGGKNSGGAFHRIINEMPPHDVNKVDYGQKSLIIRHFLIA